MTDEVNEVIDELGRNFESFKKANDERLKQIETKGSADPLLVEKIDKMSNSITELQEQKDQMEKALARTKRVTTDSDIEREKSAKMFAQQMAKIKGVPVDQSFGVEQMNAYKSAFNQMMRKGEEHINLDAQKALSVGSDPDGGYTVDPDTNGRIVNKLFETSPMRQVASVQTIGTDALEGLNDLDEAGANWVGETETRAETDTPQLQKWRIPVHELYAKPKATQKLLDDSMVNIEQWLASKVADRMARRENAAFINGDGVGKPRGILTYGNGTSIPGTIERFNTGVNGGFATDGSGGDVIYNTLYGLKQGYRNAARWAMNRTTVAEVRKIKDADGEYLWQPGLAAGEPSTLAGYNIIEFEDMPDPATDSLSIAFADFGEAYQIVDRSGIRVLRDPYSSKPYIEFYTVKRVGGDVLNFEAIKLIEFTS